MYAYDRAGVCVKSGIPATIPRKLMKIRKIFFCPFAENKFAEIEIRILSLWPFGNSAGPKTQKRKMEKQNSGKTSFRYIYFTSWNNQDNFLYNHFNHRFDLEANIDFYDAWKYEISGKLVSLAAIELFEAEKCICNGHGLKVGTYEFTEDDE